MKADLLVEAQRLSITERIELVAEIWNSVAEDAGAEELPLTDAQRRMLDERLEAYQADPTAGSSWADVKKRLIESE